MSTGPLKTGYARLRPGAARTVLAAWVLLAGICLAMMPTPPPACAAGQQSTDNGDVALYRAEIDRVHAGENYYLAAARELPSRGYPTGSVFNWRTPLPMWLIATLPEPRSSAKCSYACWPWPCCWRPSRRRSREQPNIYRGPLPLALLLAGPLLPCLLGDLYVMPVLWAGIFIGLVRLRLRPGSALPGAAAGLAAVFFRELALPYCLLGAALAAHRAAPRRTGRLADRPGGLGGLLRPALAASETAASPPTPRPIARAGSNSAASPSSRRPCK